jgi:dTDP-4-amino-4,6-dideoxy-D-galactose acyltransferase
MPHHDLVELLPWDSEFFGCRIARVKTNQVGPESGARILQWCAEEQIDCLYFLADLTGSESTAWAEDAGFRLIDLRTTLTFDQRTAGPAGGSATTAARVSPAGPVDLPALRRIARVSHRDSRFYWDVNLKHKSDDLFETWIAKSCEDYADMVLVAKLDGAPAGYITLNYSAPNDSGIELFAVGPEVRGRGVGRQLLSCGLDWLRSKGALESHVVTQGRNVSALQVYQKAGFRVENLQLWYHLWLGRPQVP